MALDTRRKKAGAVLALALLCFAPFAANPQDTAAAPAEVKLTLPQVRKLAIEALQRGQPELAEHLAKGLLKADPKSAFAYFTLSNAQAMMDRPAEARRSAAKSYRYADNKLNRFEAAELAARLSFNADRPTLSQLWLRRAVQNAPNAQVEQQLGRDYGVVRSQNPLSFSLRGGVRPSNNVNNGSNTTVQVIDGLPFTGTLSGSALALSGTIGTIDASVGYRLRGDAKSRTQIGARLFYRLVALDNDSRDLVPDLNNSDFSSAFGEVNLRHDFRLGKTGNSAYVNAAVGQYRFGGERIYEFVRLEAGRNWGLSETTRLRLTGTVEQRFSARDNRLDSTTLALLGGLSHKLSNGDRLSFGMNLRHTDSDFSNARTQSATISGTYSFGKQVGPAKISAGLVAGYSDYPDYVALFEVPGGRQDKSLYPTEYPFISAVQYPGFAPTLQVAAGRKFSNVSRFDTEELSVSLGIQSKF